MGTGMGWYLISCVLDYGNLVGCDDPVLHHLGGLFLSSIVQVQYVGVYLMNDKISWEPR